MAENLRALYYVVMPEAVPDREEYLQSIKANENNLNQNFTALFNKIEELEQRLSSLE